MSELTILQRFGMAVDRRYLKEAGATGIPGSVYQVLLICFHPYQGERNLNLNGVTIHPGDMIAEFHLSNRRILEMGREASSRSMEWRLFEALRGEFTALAAACVINTIPASVQGFYGVNILAAGAKRLGFTLVPLPKGWNRWWLSFWETFLRRIFYSFKTKKKANFQKTKEAFEIWITREELLKRYLRP
ncbi:MAG TPA: hypothetical protein DDW50_19825 [Firmicutes bacterium]|jgi:hypothetical protein|nr:hypothetical protein [Bacillota bacterium]